MLRVRISDELKIAMKAKDEIRVSTIRLINAALKDRDIQARDVAILMVLLKVARAKFGHPSMDTYIDMVGYSAIAGELAHEDNQKHGDTSSKVR